MEKSNLAVFDRHAIFEICDPLLLDAVSGGNVEEIYGDDVAARGTANDGCINAVCTNGGNQACVNPNAACTNTKMRICAGASENGVNTVCI